MGWLETLWAQANADGDVTQEELRAISGAVGAVQQEIRELRTEEKQAADAQVKLQIRALKEGGVQLYNALVKGGVIDAPMLDVPAPEYTGEVASVFTRNGVPHVQIGSAQQGYRYRAAE